MNTKQTTTHIDATGLSCPVPLMLLKQAMDKLPASGCVQIDVTDVHAELDFEIWCERFGHHLEKTQESEGVIGFSVVKNAAMTAIG